MIVMDTREEFIPQDPEYERRVRESYRRQTALETIGATLTRVQPGVVEIHMPYNACLAQQNGFMHAGIITTIVDTACGYAACTLTPSNANVLTVEFKANFMAPARGELFIATGRVLRAGKTLAVCQGEVRARTAGGGESVVAAMQATIMVLVGQASRPVQAE
jgi:uncharacterized protein (TIGR00369 family)